MFTPRAVVGFLLLPTLVACAGEAGTGMAAVRAASPGAAQPPPTLAAELGCGACHAGMPASAVVRERAPDLGEDGRRPPAAFLFGYLRNPVALRTDIGRSRMPDFHLDSAEAAALTLFLLERQGTPLPEGEGPGPVRRARRDPAVDAARGERIARALNCAGCHDGTGLARWSAGPPLAAEEDRARRAWLRRWLLRPRAVRPYGFRPGTGSRMPDFGLSPAEADTLAAELAGRPAAEASRDAAGRTEAAVGVRDGPHGATDGAGAGPELPPLSPYQRAKADALLRRRLPCLGCHRLGGEGGRIGPSLDDVGERRPAAHVLDMIRAPGDQVPGTVMPRVPMPGNRARLLARRLLDGAGPGAAGERDAAPDRGGREPDAEPEAGRGAPRHGYLSLVDHPLRPPEAHERRAGGGSSADGADEAAGRSAGAGGEALYRSACAACHGARGSGNGYNARYLPVRPTPHASAELMARRADATLFDGIHAGGRILGRSHLMPPFGDRLDRDEIWSLVRHVRGLCDCRGPGWARDGADPTDARSTDPAVIPDTAPGPGTWGESPGRDPDATPLAFGPTPDSVEAGDFVGAGACRSCHAEAYEAWAESTHGAAGGPPEAGVVVAPFDDDTIRFRDATVVATRSAGGEYVFDVAWDGHGTTRYTVDGVVGKGHMVGGGNQGFFTRWRDGSYRFLPFDFSRTEGRWFCNTIGRRDRGWRPAVDVELADCSDWPPSRALGNVRRLNNCQECHGSQIRVRVQRGAPHFETSFTSLRVNCESCHGPGREHVRLARDGRVPGREDIAIDGLAGAGKDASLRVCFRCHALKTPLEDGYLPGRGFRERYALLLPMLGGRPYFPDGRVRTFAYQGTHLSSQCYLAGSMTCTDCHEPHGQGYRDHVGRPLEGRFSDGQCTSCHASKAGPAGERHSRHPANSEGSRCVACHMPYLQELELGPEIRYARSDHTIPVPRPGFDGSLALDGHRLRSACEGCHEDHTPAELQRQAERWWGDLKPQDPLVRGLLSADTVRDLGRSSKLLLQPGKHDPMAQYQGLGRLVTERLWPDMPALPPTTRDRLERLARAGDLEVRALALAALHYARGQDPATRRFLTARANELGSVRTAVERRWAVILGHLADGHRDAGELRRALITYRKALEMGPDRADLHLAMGRAHAAAGQEEEALASYRRSLELSPDRALPWVNIGIVHASRGRPEQAVEAYRSALEINPAEPLAHFNLGNLHLRAGRPAQAAEAYRAALERDPGLAPAHFNLVRALLGLERYREALAALRRGLAYEPDRPQARDLARRLEEALEER